MPPKRTSLKKKLQRKALSLLFSGLKENARDILVLRFFFFFLSPSLFSAFCGVICFYIRLQYSENNVGSPQNSIFYSPGIIVFLFFIKALEIWILNIEQLQA